MKISKGLGLACLAVLVLLFCFTSQGMAITLRPWGTAETSLFSTKDVLPKNVGSGWFGNDLILNYGGQPSLYDDVDGISILIGGEVSNFIPTDALGISFGVSRTSQIGYTRVWLIGWPLDMSDFIVQDMVVSMDDNTTMDFKQITKHCLFCDQVVDIPESTVNGITAVEFFFDEDLLDAPLIGFVFQSDSRIHGIGLIAGNTTFHNVSWIIADSTYPPPPGVYTCFIATAAYGSYLDPHVEILRQFRDQYLVTNWLGNRMVSLYYQYSPPIAHVIAEHELLKTIVKIALLPLVVISCIMSSEIIKKSHF